MTDASAPMPGKPRRPPMGLALGLAMLTVACSDGRPGVDGFFEVGGGQVDLWCDGGDGPAIMFVAAIGGDHSLVPIAEELADEAYVCFYDRPGDGETRPPTDRRTAGEDAADLHELVEAAALPTPMTLVAHSYGGLVAVVAAAEHPEEIAGVVFVDASHHDQERQLDAVLSEEQRARLDEQEAANFPYIDWYGSLADAAAAHGDFPDLPVTVITAADGWRDCGDGLPCAEMQRIWLDVQAELGRIAPDVRHVTADTGHYVHEDDPDLVVAEVRAILERIAARGS